MLGERYKSDGKPILKLSERQLAARTRFLDECDSMISHYQFENFACECGATEDAFEVLSEKDRYGLKVRTVMCRKCGLMMTNPRMTQESYDYFYDMEYGSLYRDQDVIPEEYFRNKIMIGKEIYDFVEKYSGIKVQDVLEIGCAAGGILQYFKNQGCNVTGVDLGNDYIEFGKSKGLNLINCHSQELVKSGKKFDLIILNHVFEHFLNIEKELDAIRQLLTDEGMLYIAVPGVKALVETYNNDFMLFLQNAHVYHFTLRTLEQVANKYGFGLHVGTEEIQALFKYTGEHKEFSRNYYLENMKFLYELEYALQKRRGLI